MAEGCDARHPLGPDFLGIGAPRCGTTWLYSVLGRHPDVWLPPIKEVHYFDSIDESMAEHFAVHRSGYRVQRFLLRRLMHYVAAGVVAVAPRALNLQPKPDFRWDRNYFRPGGSMEWYCNLFDAQRPRARVVGEITPAYICLALPVIQLIRQNLTTRRFILLLRDPIDAAWSGIGRRLREGQARISLDDDEELVRKVLGPGLGRFTYAEHLIRWRSVFEPDCIFVGFYEDLVHDPHALVRGVFDFLGVEMSRSTMEAMSDLRKKVNSSEGARKPIPALVERALASRLVEDLAVLSGILGGPTDAWHVRAVRSLEGRNGK